MAATYTLQSDFTAGELSPSILARVDLAKYSKGARTMRNFIVQSHGPAVKRPGFIRLGTLPGPAVLLEFVFNKEQTYALVFGEKWMRVAVHDGFVLGSDGKPYQIATPYTLEQARQLSFVQSGDVLFLTCQEVVPYRLMRFAHADWRFEAMNFDEPIAPPVNITTEFVNDAKDSEGEQSEAQLVTPYTYRVSSVNKDGKESGLSEVTSGAEITGPASNNWQAGDFLVVTWGAVTGAEEYRVYKSSFGGRAGYVATVGDTEWRDFNVSPSVGEGAPNYINPFVLTGENGEEVHDYPGAICIFEQRLVFASSPRRPQSIWMSKSGDYTNFARYTPIADDSPIDLTIASREVSPVNWVVSLRSLILGTQDMEWEIAGRGDAAFSARNAKATPQSYWGSSLKRAMIIGNVILHVSSSGAQVRNLQYDFGSDSYGGTDLSILAQHLFDGHHVVDWAHQKYPDSIVWAVRSDGVLLGLTFQSEHQIAAWHRHDTQGAFRSVCSVPHDDEYSLFAVVERDGVFSLECMGERYHGGDPSRHAFLDAAVVYDHAGEPIQTLSGLEHLEGKTVGVLSKGAVESPRVVAEGKVRLDAPSDMVIVGLLYTADLETMPIEVVGDGGSSVALKKQISTVNIAFHESLGVKVGFSRKPGNLDTVRWQGVNWRTNEPYGTPPAPFTGIKEETLPSLAENVVSVCVRSELPTPVSVQSLVAKVTVNA